jgi:hypothetical protein
VGSCAREKSSEERLFLRLVRGRNFFLHPETPDGRCIR